MIDTRLILIEGILGSGKSTTAAYLTDRMKKCGRRCRWFHEYAGDNPIRVDVRGGFEGTDPWDEPDKTLPQWKALVRAKRRRKSVTILECKLWQNEALFRFLADQPVTKVIASHQRIVEAIAELGPVLIHFVHDDLDKHLAWVFEDRRDSMQEWDDREHQPWPEWMIGVMESSARCRRRGLTGYAGLVTMFREWLEVCKTLFENFKPFKLEVRNPHENWEAVYQQIEQLLGLI